jgi:hypothetical protein
MLILNPGSRIDAAACHTLFTSVKLAHSHNRDMGTARNLASVTVIVGMAVFIATWLAVESRAQAQDAALVGAWTLNRDASDQSPARGDRNRGGDDAQGRRGGYGRRGGGMGRGGFGGGMGRGAASDPQEMARMRDAMRDVMNPPDHLTIVQSGSLVLITGDDGRTTRLSPDGKKVKDENTKVERKTKWDDGKLVSEISGLGPGKMTQTFSVDPEHHQLRIAVQTEGGRQGQPRTFTQVYDADAKPQR